MRKEAILSIALLCFSRNRVPSDAVRLFVNSIEILAEDLVHGEHMHAILFEHRSERFVAPDLTLVFRIL